MEKKSTIKVQDDNVKPQVVVIQKPKPQSQPCGPCARAKAAREKARIEREKQLKKERDIEKKKKLEKEQKKIKEQEKKEDNEKCEYCDLIES